MNNLMHAQTQRLGKVSHIEDHNFFPIESNWVFSRRDGSQTVGVHIHAEVGEDI